ncbi:hypothetical protein KSP40_PGU021313 [Platanthera guangdongensis]|uniref:Uncharacterized protein n=1 Tax=Platanthera guangdongensis TaxID=2320717 RepID=A0ABR2LYF9_9ASPA
MLDRSSHYCWIAPSLPSAPVLVVLPLDLDPPLLSHIAFPSCGRFPPPISDFTLEARGTSTALTNTTSSCFIFLLQNRPTSTGETIGILCQRNSQVIRNPFTQERPGLAILTQKKDRGDYLSLLNKKVHDAKRVTLQSMPHDPKLKALDFQVKLKDVGLYT